MGTRAVPVPKPSESGPNRRLYRALRRSRGRGRNPSRNEGVSGTPREAESRSTSWRSLVRAQYRPSHRQAVFRDVRSSEMGLFVIVVGVWSDFAIAWRKAASRRRNGRAGRRYESAPLRNSVRARLQALTDSIREPPPYHEREEGVDPCRFPPTGAAFRPSAVDARRRVLHGR